MLSFFSKKKHNAETPPEEVIQGPGDATNNGSDEFIFVEKKPDDKPGSQQPASMYPPIPPAPFGIGGLPYPGGYHHPATPSAHNTTPVPYVQGVPFELSPQLCSKSAFEMTQLQVDGILALLTRQMSVEEDYDFNLERSVQNECY